jgi:hypothetical protein
LRKSKANLLCFYHPRQKDIALFQTNQYNIFIIWKKNRSGFRTGTEERKKWIYSVTAPTAARASVLFPWKNPRAALA